MIATTIICNIITIIIIIINKYYYLYYRLLQLRRCHRWNITQYNALYYSMLYYTTIYIMLLDLLTVNLCSWIVVCFLLFLFFSCLHIEIWNDFPRYSLARRSFIQLALSCSYIFLSEGSLDANSRAFRVH